MTDQEKKNYLDRIFSTEPEKLTKQEQLVVALVKQTQAEVKQLADRVNEENKTIIEKNKIIEELSKTIIFKNGSIDGKLEVLLAARANMDEAGPLDTAK